MSILNRFSILFCRKAAALPLLLSALASPATAGDLKLSTLANWETGIYGKSAAEIVVFQKSTGQIYFVNGATPAVEVIRLDAGGQIKPVTRLTLAKSGKPHQRGRARRPDRRCRA